MHELRELTADGFALGAPAAQDDLFSQACEMPFRSAIGEWRVDGAGYTAEAVDGFAACSLGEMPHAALIEARIVAQLGTRGCGLLLRCDSALEHYYQIRWEPGRGRAVIDRWPRPGDDPYMLERAIPDAGAGSLQLKIFVEGTVLVVYINAALALNCRMYNHSSGRLGLFVSEGGAAFEDVRMRMLPPR